MCVQMFWAVALDHRTFKGAQVNWDRPGVGEEGGAFLLIAVPTAGAISASV